MDTVSLVRESDRKTSIHATNIKHVFVLVSRLSFRSSIIAVVACLLHLIGLRTIGNRLLQIVVSKRFVRTPLVIYVEGKQILSGKFLVMRVARSRNVSRKQLREFAQILGGQTNLIVRSFALPLIAHADLKAKAGILIRGSAKPIMITKSVPSSLGTRSGLWDSWKSLIGRMPW